MFRWIIPGAAAAGLALAGCQSLSRAQADLSRATFPGIAKVDVGKAEIDWLALRGSISRLSVTTVRGPLKSASLTLFEDINGNGLVDFGEEVKSYTTSESGEGLVLTDVTLSASELAGRRPDKLQVLFSVIDGDGKSHVHSTSI
ncbi:MAG: hypothetical protein RL277_1424 [Planctomycetota bacterium]|jgi:hypothetical protein